MTHGFLPTLAIAVIGLLAARMGDLLRTPVIGRKPCDNTHGSGVVWSYDAETAGCPESRL